MTSTSWRWKLSGKTSWAVSHEKVSSNVDRVALERGPIVYCAEGWDNEGRALDLAVPRGSSLRPERSDLFGGVVILRGEALTAIPYFAWAHRGPGEMAVWLRRSPSGS
ncbi:MAG: hypothetical protein ACRD3V_05410 [Vicinamibacteria bacterium]